MECVLHRNGKSYKQCCSMVKILPGTQAVGNSFSGQSFSMVRGVFIKHVASPPIALSSPNTLNGNSWCICIRAPIYGADSSQILAHTTQEKTRIFRFFGSTNSAVHVNKIDWEHDTAIFGIIAVNINRPTFMSGDTVKYKEIKIWIFFGSLYCH